METKEFRFKDKSAWGPGPWQEEPDKKQWTDATTGMPCLLVRGPFGALCGYVGVAEGHPLFGEDYETPDVSVHGGLTFAAPCAEGDPDHGICHTPGPGEPDHVWWFGFDCAHYMDFIPDLRRRESSYEPGGMYRDQAYVENECASLAQQLKDLS